jgi:hypothetical protein
MKKRFSLIAILVILLCAGLNAFYQEDDEKEEGKNYFINLSLFHPVSINQTKQDSININLSLIYGHVGYVTGLDLSVFASAISEDLRGLQVCGLAGIVGASGQGVQFSGLSNIVGDRFSGVQMSGLANIIGNSFAGIQSSGLANIVGNYGSGIQSSGFFNVIGEKFSGIQMSGAFNIVGESGSGLQAGGLFNITGEDFTGFQASGLMNITGGTLKGLQSGVFNIAAESSGVQTGVVNVAGNSKGFQLGLVNFCREENTGVPFGVVNIARNGKVRMTLWGGNEIAVTVGAKFKIRNLYSIVSLGAVNLDDKISESLTYGFHYGASFPLNNFNLNADLGYRFRDNKTLFRSPVQDPDQHILEARLGGEVPLSDDITLILGTGLSCAFDRGKHMNTGRISPLIIAGIEVF